MALSKAAQELIEKLAVSGGWVSGVLSRKGPVKPGIAGIKDRPGQTAESRLRKAGDRAAFFSPGREKARDSSTLSEGSKKRHDSARLEAGNAVSREIDRRGELRGAKTGSMHDIISDIIKGAKDNSFGRPVHIQQGNDEWTPLDTAKCAGMLHALGEKDYSVKEASEFLGLSEERITYVLNTVE